MYVASVARNNVAAWIVVASIGGSSLPACAWGDAGHAIVARIAYGLLAPDVRLRVRAMLDADDDELTAHDIEAEATWADKLRESNRAGARSKTRQWHFVDIELEDPDIDAACFRHPRLSEGAVAADGVADDCIVDKIEQFAAELAAPDTEARERLAALKFMLHFVGDLHQPLHACDARDRGGNDKRVSADGFQAGNLHRYWDVDFIRRLGDSPQVVATQIAATIGNEQRTAWSSGTVSDWAMESFAVCRDAAYAGLGEATSSDRFRLSAAYVRNAIEAVRTQLARAGVRLAQLLNRALADAR